MLGRLNFFCGQNDEVQYRPVAGVVVDVPAVQDNTKLFKRIPADVLALIASKLSKEDLIAFSLVNKKNYRVYKKYFDHTELFNKLKIEHLAHVAKFLPKESLIPFFLTNKNTLHAFEDFKGNAKHGELRVWMLTSDQSVYRGHFAEVNFRDVNHVLMAEYFLNIKKHELEAHEDEIRQQDHKRECLVFGISVTLGVVIGLAIHAGAAALLDRVVLPACFKCCVTNSTAADANCCCAGNICSPETIVDKAVIGRYIDPWGNVLWNTMRIPEYQVCNVCCVYIPAPLPASCTAGCGIGCMPKCEPCSDCMLGPNYDARHYQLANAIWRMNAANKSNFVDIIELNTRLRERKIGGDAYRLFHAPKPVNMQDEVENPAIAPAAPVADTNIEPMRRIAME